MQVLCSTRDVLSRGWDHRKIDSCLDRTSPSFVSSKGQFALLKALPEQPLLPSMLQWIGCTTTAAVTTITTCSSTCAK